MLIHVLIPGSGLRFCGFLVRLGDKGSNVVLPLPLYPRLRISVALPRPETFSQHTNPVFIGFFLILKRFKTI